MRRAVLRFRLILSGWLITLLLCLLEPFLVGSIPLYVCTNEGSQWPLLRRWASRVGLSDAGPHDYDPQYWQQLPVIYAFWPPIRYDPWQLDLSQPLQPPSGFSCFEKDSALSHWLGTDPLGRDVSAGLMAGLNTGLGIAVSALSIALVLGVLLGGAAGFWGNNGILLPWFAVLTLPLWVLVGWFWGFTVWEPAWQEAFRQGGPVLAFYLLAGICIFIGVVMSGTWIATKLNYLLVRNPRLIGFPLDTLVVRLAEAFTAFPRLLVLVALASVLQPGWWGVVLLIGLLWWPSLARLYRNTLISETQKDYVLAAKALGYSPWRILFRHIIPNTGGPVAVAIANGVAGIILAEASLSFLGLGLPQDQITWGRQLMMARQAPEAWWLSLFPTLCLIALIALCNASARYLEEKHHPLS
ncbi:MAG: ABC transporter permease [Flavobacteriales bacterium]|nr:ABC transporter permease [Flavobacteriales bacterium]MDW8409154.1 ABC transporter permease [Flavobacteriales bacterium]